MQFRILDFLPVIFPINIHRSKKSYGQIFLDKPCFVFVHWFNNINIYSFTAKDSYKLFSSITFLFIHRSVAKKMLGPIHQEIHRQSHLFTTKILVRLSTERYC